MGLDDAIVDAIRDRTPMPAMAPEEEELVYFGTEFYTTHKVSQDTFQKALDQFLHSAKAQFETQG